MAKDKEDFVDIYEDLKEQIEIEEAELKMNGREKRFCDLVLYEGCSNREAALKAGWSVTTINNNGPGYIAKRPHVKKYIDLVRKHKGDSEYLGYNKMRAGKLERAAGVAFDRLMWLMLHGENHNVQLKACVEIIKNSRAVVEAALGKGEDVDSHMRKMYDEFLKDKKNVAMLKEVLSEEPIEIEGERIDEVETDSSTEG